MTTLLELKEKLVRFYGKNEIYVKPVIRFVLALFTFLVINNSIGYMKLVSKTPVAVILALVCSMLPVNGLIAIAALVVLADLYALSIEVLISAREKAEESDRMKSAFLANMSHEIRTPLNAIVGFSNLMNSEEVLEPEEREQFVKLINTNSDLLLKLINDILDLSRMESGKMSFVFDRHDLNVLINEIYCTFQLMMPEGVELRMRVPEIPVVVAVDPYRLKQVLSNFINNAIKFTTSGYIEVGYYFCTKGDCLHIYVEDTGIGIPEEKQKQVFDRFCKLDEFAQGTGLGLAICQVIAQRFGGEIQLKSEYGKGSRFTLTLPKERIG